MERLGDRSDALKRGLRDLAEELGIRTAFVVESCPGREGHARTLVLYSAGEFLENRTYAVAGTPTAHILEHGVCFHSRGVAEMYPEDDSLPFFGAESYLGVAVCDPAGSRLAHVGVLDDAPFADPKGLETRLRQFAAELAEFLVPSALPAEVSCEEAEEQDETAVPS